MSITERKSIENGIWLCGSCSSLIDNNNGADYSVLELKKWKLIAEKKARYRLENNIPPKTEKWEGRLNSITYANVPRLLQRLPSSTPSVDVIQTLSNGFPDGYIAPYLLALERGIASFEIDAAPLELFNSVTDMSIGSIISFDFNGRTENWKPDIPKDIIQQFNKAKSPHFYYKNKDWEWVFPYDPKWVTTTTAHVEFSSGRAWFAGLGIIKQVKHDEKLVIVSPLVVGLPRRDIHDLLGF